MVVVKAARRLKDRISLCTSSKEALEEEEKKRKEENKESLKGKRRKEGALACEDPCEVEEMPALVVEEEVETSKKKKKRREEEGPENPFHLAPNKYTRSVLGVVEPFLCIDDSGTMPHFNKFTPWQMHEGALTQAISYMAAHISLVEETMGAAGTTKTEGNLRPYHMSLLCPFKLMTRPSAEEYSALQINMRGKKIEDYIQDTAEDDVTDLVITCPENDQEDAMALQKGSLSSSNEGLDIDHEAAPQGEDNIKKQGCTDFRVFVRDKRIMKRELPKKKLRELQTKRLVAVVESKFVEEEGAVFQAVAYARHEVLRNLQNMHVEPVYLVVVAASRWTYAILDVHSSLRLDDNRITAEAFSDYLEIQRLQSEGEDRGHSESDLKLRLNEKIKSLKDGYKMSKFLNKKYLVGDLYLCHQWYDLPTALRGSGFASSGACLFFEGFMRIIVGNRVLKWHESDVDKVYNIRNTFMHLGQKFRGGLDIKL